MCCTDDGFFIERAALIAGEFQTKLDTICNSDNNNYSVSSWLFDEGAIDRVSSNIYREYQRLMS